MWKREDWMLWWLKRYLKVLRHKMSKILTDLLLKTGKLGFASSTLSDRTDTSSISVFFRPSLYSCISHVKCVQNTEIQYWLAALEYKDHSIQFTISHCSDEDSSVTTSCYSDDHFSYHQWLRWWSRSSQLPSVTTVMMNITSLTISGYSDDEDQLSYISGYSADDHFSYHQWLQWWRSLQLPSVTILMMKIIPVTMCG